MKYIITERQHNIIKESNIRASSFKRLIDYHINDMRETCEEDMEYDEYMCEMLDMIESIDVEGLVPDSKNANYYIYLIFNYYSHGEPEFSDFYYSYIAPHLRKLFGTHFYLRYKANQLIKPY